MFKKTLLSILLGALFTLSISAQFEIINPPENWFNLDESADGTAGMSTEKAYKDLLRGKTSKPVIVAVLDSGVDVEHEDLKANIWVNRDEIPENGVDDDANGYVDDVHGWNFLGSATEDVVYDNLEFTRVYRSLLRRFEGKNSDKCDKDHG